MTSILRGAALAVAFSAAAWLPAAGARAAALGQWRAYMAYHDVQQVCEAGRYLFVRASNSLYQYNADDQSIVTYDKVNGLSDTYITAMAWNAQARRLVVVYDNSNIDLVATDGDVANIPDLYLKAMTEDKTVNSITVSGNHAYLATNFGVVKVNVATAEISETYILGIAVARVGLASGNIYVRSASGEVLCAALSDNLIDRNSWAAATSYPQGIFDVDDSETADNLQLVSTLAPGGPAYNNFGFLRFSGGRLYCVNGRSDVEYPATLQVYDGRGWTLFEGDLSGQTGHAYRNLYCCDVDPRDTSHVFAGGQTGLYEFRHGRFIKEYNVDNSPLQTAGTVGNNNKNYVLVTGLKYAADGSLWVANSTAPSASLFELRPDGTWVSHHDDRLLVESGSMTFAMENLKDLTFDSRGVIWLNNDYWHVPGVVRYDAASGRLNVCKSFANQDGLSLTLTSINSLAEDREGNIWFATNVGPVYISSAEAAAGTDDFTFVQPKIPRNDGSNLADYLLNNIPVKTLAIDGANRKWLGTTGNGVYLISADNMTQLRHFTTENSPLLSDNILSIAIDGATGEVFFGTDRGLCSYMSDATSPAEEMDKDNVYAYPNPVEPGYTGLITVVGLSFDADVKVTTATGYLVAEGRSTGGTFTWDGRDRYGKRVASGVYNIVTAKSDGSKGTVCKVAVVR